MTDTSDLRRELGPFDALTINVGTMVGSGIFLVPSVVAANLGGTVPMTLVWLVGGLVSLCGALAMAELGAMMPDAGGQFVYLRRAWGPLWGWLYGWTTATLINPASIAAIAVGFASYAVPLFSLTRDSVPVVAAASILAFTGLNCLGLRLGAATQNLLTALKVAAVVALVVLGLVLPAGDPANLAPFWPEQGGAQLARGVALAMVAVLWAYDGWVEITYVGSEVRDPGRVIPTSIIGSVLITAAAYALVSVSLAYVLTPAGMAASPTVAAEAARHLLGTGGVIAVSAAIAISTLGANNGIIFTAARIPYAMARAGELFRAFGRVHPRYRTPIFALVVQGIWSSLLVFTGTYDQLITYVIVASFVFYGMAAAAVLRLRRREPAAPRPYRAWGYPVTPIVFVVCAAALVVGSIITAPRDAAIGAGMIVIGLPLYFVFRRSDRKQPSQ